MAKEVKRYIIKKTSESGRGGGPRVMSWYVYDTQTRSSVSATSIVKDYAQNLCDTLNKDHETKVFEKEVLDVDKNL